MDFHGGGDNLLVVFPFPVEPEEVFEVGGGGEAMASLLTSGITRPFILVKVFFLR